MQLTKLIAFFLAAILIASVMTGCASSANSFNQAQELFDSGNYNKALELLSTIPDYDKTPELARLCQQNIDYQEATRLLESGDYAAARASFQALGGFQDSAQKVSECQYAAADALMANEKWDEAQAAFIALGSFSDAPEKALAAQAEIDRVQAEADKAQAELNLTQIDDYLNTGAYDQAHELLETMPDAPELLERRNDAWLRLAGAYIDNDQLDKARVLKHSLPGALPSDLREKYAYVELIEFINETMSVPHDPILGNPHGEEIESRAAKLGNYKLAPVLTAIFGALKNDDMKGYSEAIFANMDELSKVINMWGLAEGALSSRKNGFDAMSLVLAAMPENAALRGLATGSVAAKDLATGGEPGWWSESDKVIFNRCSAENQGKLMVFVREYTNNYILNLKATAALPESLRPNSLEEVGYVLIIDYSADFAFWYDNNYTTAMQPHTDVILYSAPKRRAVKNLGRVKGGAPPKTYSYSGNPPPIVYGSDPDQNEIRAKYLEAVEFLESQAE